MLLDHVRVHKLLPSLQSAYRAQHSTETAVLKVLSDILTAADRGDLSMLTLLDLSAAFDTVDHPILLRRLMTSHGVNGVVHSWISSYLANRTQYVRCPGSRSTPLPVLCGVPQGSVLGPILFLLYTADLVQLVESLELLHTYTLTTPRSMASVDPGTPTLYGNVLLTALLPSLIGCVLIDFSSMHPRRKYCGALQPVDKVSYLPIRWLLALISCRRSNACAISVFSLTLT